MTFYRILLRRYLGERKLNIEMVTQGVKTLREVNYWGWDMISYYREIPKRALVDKVQVPRNSGLKKRERDLHKLCSNVSRNKYGYPAKSTIGGHFSTIFL